MFLEATDWMSNSQREIGSTIVFSWLTYQNILYHVMTPACRQVHGAISKTASIRIRGACSLSAISQPPARHQITAVAVGSRASAGWMELMMRSRDTQRGVAVHHYSTRRLGVFMPTTVHLMSSSVLSSIGHSAVSLVMRTHAASDGADIWTHSKCLTLMTTEQPNQTRTIYQQEDAQIVLWTPLFVTCTETDRQTEVTKTGEKRTYKRHLLACDRQCSNTIACNWPR